MADRLPFEEGYSRCLVKGSVLKADYVQRGVTTVIKKNIPKSWKFKSLND